MDALKVQFYFDRPVILNRLTTLDSILLRIFYTYFKKSKDFIPTYEDKDTDFILKKNNTFSGSIWYIPEEEKDTFDIDNIVCRKFGKADIAFKMGLKEWNKSFRKQEFVNLGTGYFRSYQIIKEIMFVKSIYFYITADRIIVEKLLKKLKFIGEKYSLGYGKIKEIKIDEIDDMDKGFFLDKERRIPSRPLSCLDWKDEDIDWDMVGYYRANPPYWNRENLVPCYIPVASLLEKDCIKERRGGKIFPLKNFSPCYFVYNSFLKRKKMFKRRSDNNKFCVKPKDKEKEEICIICNEKYKAKEGIYIEKLKEFFGANFTSYEIIKYPISKKSNNLFLCKYCDTCLSYITNVNHCYIDIKGKKRDFPVLLFEEIEKAKIDKPFVLSVKVKKNQHTLFYTTPTISQNLITIGYGDNKRYFVDRRLLNEALKDIERLKEKYNVSLYTLINFEMTPSSPSNGFKQKNSTLNVIKYPGMEKELIEEVRNFWLKYPREVRRVVYRITDKIKKKVKKGKKKKNEEQ